MCLGRADAFAKPGDRRAFRWVTTACSSSVAPTDACAGSSTPVATASHELLPCGRRGVRQVHPLPVPRVGVQRPKVSCTASHRPMRPTSTDAPTTRLKPVRHRRVARLRHGEPHGDAPPLAEYFSGIEKWLDPSAWVSCGWVTPTPTPSTTNWKLIVENYHECFHCATVHPELVRRR